MKLSDHFTLEELIASKTGEALGIDNTPSEIITDNLRALASKLEEVRALLGVPIKLNSGYRCPILNAAVKGSESSRHMLGLAADFVAPKFGTPYQIAVAIQESDIVFDQLIHEHTWVHIGLPIPGEKPRSMAMTLLANRTYAIGIHEKDTV